MPCPSSIGAKRNLGIRGARGSIIAQWDDDDWYADEPASAGRSRRSCAVMQISRVSTQASLRSRCLGVLALHPGVASAAVRGGRARGDPGLGRHVWERLGRYPDGSAGEDALFLRVAQRGGARPAEGRKRRPVCLHAPRDQHLLFPLGRYLDPTGWLRTREPAFFEADRDFYARMCAGSTGSPQSQPLVSCIMPTYNRPHFVPQAISYFLRQDYPNRELLILDDGEERVAGVVPSDPRIRYIALAGRLVLGTKRNRACDLAAGDIIAHWDDDDWMAPRRLSYQVRTLLEAGADLCGAPRQIYYDPVRDRAWLYQSMGGRQRYVAGNTLCYRRTYWQANPFPEIQVGEDTRFIWGPHARNLVATPDCDYYVGLLHANNTSPKGLNPPHWSKYSADEVHRLLGQDLLFYRPQ